MCLLSRYRDREAKLLLKNLSVHVIWSDQLSGVEQSRTGRWRQITQGVVIAEEPVPFWWIKEEHLLALRSGISGLVHSCASSKCTRGRGSSKRQTPSPFAGFHMRVWRRGLLHHVGSKDWRLACPLAAATAANSALIRDNIRLMFMALMAVFLPCGLVARALSFRRREVSLRGCNVTWRCAQVSRDSGCSHYVWLS